jgi:hypothetical protein
MDTNGHEGGAKKATTDCTDYTNLGSRRRGDLVKPVLSRAEGVPRENLASSPQRPRRT